MNNKRNFVLFVRGLPGSGKSTLSSLIYKTLEATVLDPDKVDTSIFKTSDNLSRIKTIKYRHLLNLCTEYVSEGKNVIWEQPWRKSPNIALTVHKIDSKLEHLKTAIPVFLVCEVSIDKNVSWERSYRKFKNRSYFEEYVGKYLVYDLNFPYLKVNGEDKPEKLALDVINWVASYLRQ